MVKKEVKKEHIALYGKSQFEYLVFILFVFIIFAIITTSLVWGSGLGNVKANPSVSGSGFLSETITMIGEPKDTVIKVAKISFSGRALLIDGAPSGNWHLKFFDVVPDILDNAEFRAEEIESLSFGTSACGNSAHIQAFGKFNNKLGYYAFIDISQLGDSTSMRIRLYYPEGTMLYDSANQFAKSCEDLTLVDSGNLKITMPQ
jgi:hypothetical protein